MADLPTGYTPTVPPGRSVDIKGLTSGTLYQFRVRTVGPKELEVPWSDIAEHIAP